jgi:hypothetical protein
VRLSLDGLRPWSDFETQIGLLSDFASMNDAVGRLSQWRDEMIQGKP